MIQYEIRNAMENLQKSRHFNLDEKHFKSISPLFSARKSSIVEPAQTIDNIYQESGYFADPHTAVALKSNSGKQKNTYSNDRPCDCSSYQIS